MLLFSSDINHIYIYAGVELPDHSSIFSFLRNLVYTVASKTDSQI